MNTFYWHDYETWGSDPSIDRPSQFAGVRTDQDLNVLGEPLVMYCKPPEDIWPTPEACLVTGITPQEAQEKGLTEKAFIEKIHAEFIQPDTCVVGYNSIRFDDEVTRYALYRNFYDPYEREWKNGNSRWDILDMLRLTYALRPNDIEWPMVDGKPSFKLENLSVANNIEHGSAHDAYSDVAATIGLAKLIKDKKSQLYNYAFDMRQKRKVAELIDIRNKKPLLHVSERFPAERGCSALVAPLAIHPTNRNAVVVYDLSVDPQPLIDLQWEEIRDRLFVATEDLPEGVARIPLKLVHLNKCPILTTPKLLEEKAAARLKIDKHQCDAHWQKLRQFDFTEKLNALYDSQDFPERSDAERQLYGGFLNDRDRSLLTHIRKCDFEKEIDKNYVFEDRRYQELFFRYKARNAYDALNDVEKKQWHEFVCQRLLEGDDETRSYQATLERIKALRQEHHDNHGFISLLDKSEAYMHERRSDLL